MATMASASTNQSNLLSNGINTNKDAQCSYCKATGHYYKSCPKLKKMKEMEEEDRKKPQRLTYPPCDTCGKKNHPTERCWQGAGAHLRPKRTQAEQKDTNASNSEGKPKTASDSEATNSSQSNTKKTDPKNYICHDSKYMTICRLDNMSFRILQQSNSAKKFRIQKVSPLLSGSNKWKKPISEHIKL